MDTQALLKKIKRQAQLDRQRRKDPRYLATMALLVGKGFLRTNLAGLPRIPGTALRIEDAVWAGKKVEPRILEVLPAAVARLPRYFDLKEAEPLLLETVAAIRNGRQQAAPLWGIPFDQFARWGQLSLPDGRTKPLKAKKTTKTYRLSHHTLSAIAQWAQSHGCTETEALEALVAR